MSGLRIAFASATVVTVFLLGFSIYQYFGLGNNNVVLSLEKFGTNRLLAAIMLLSVVFSFVLGLVSFLPALATAVDFPRGVKLTWPLCVSVASIAYCLYVSYNFILPVTPN